MGIAIKCRYKIKIACNTKSCQAKFKLKINTKIKQRGNINNFPCSVLTAGVVTRLIVTATFVDVVTTGRKIQKLF